MPAAYSQELRDRVMNAIAEGGSVSDTAERFTVSCMWIRNLTHRLQETGNYQAINPHGRAGRKRKLKAYQEQLQEVVTKTPDATLEEIAEQLPIKVHISMIARELSLLKLTYKKKYSRC